MRVGGNRSPYNVIFSSRKWLRHVDAECLCQLRWDSAKIPVFSIDVLEFYAGQLHRVVERQDQIFRRADKIAVRRYG